MEFDRRIQIRLCAPDQQTNEPKTKFGSGYLVAPRLVLTAAHVIGDTSGPWPGTLTVSCPEPGSLTGPDAGNNVPTDSARFPATVRWYRKNELIDAALIEVDDSDGWQTPQSLQEIVSRPPQRWGLLIGPRPHPVTVLGFPNMQKDNAYGMRLDEQLTGEINPGNGSLAHRYEISSTNPVLDATLAPSAPGTPWSGISGAAVHTGDLLCGVTRRDRRATAGTRLTATPAALLLADDSFRAIVSEHSAGWEPILEPVEPAGLLAPAALDRELHSPAALLRADSEAVTFHGRKQELTDLRTWCQDGAPALSVRVLTSPGGQGKTRLARQLTHALGHVGWVTGHLRSDLSDQDAPPDFTSLATALPLLVVVDYAETRPRLLRRLITYLSSSRHRVRLLLLARSDGEWRTDALNAAPRTRDLLKAGEIIELAPLLPLGRPDHNRSGPDRMGAFTRAVQDLARLLPYVPGLPECDWSALAVGLRLSDDLSDPRFDNALTLQMTALVTLLQHGPAPVRATPGAPVEEVLLEHEERFWEDSADAPAFKLQLPTPTLAGAVAVAALCGAADEEEAVCIIEKVPELPSGKATRTAAWLARLYPAASDGDHGDSPRLNRRYWGSLQPDRIAEHHASCTITAGGIVLRDVIAAASPAQQGQLITVLARSAIAHYNARRPATSTQVLQALDGALDTTGLHPQAIQTAVAALPDQSSVTAALALRLTAALAHIHLSAADSTTHGADVAGSLTSLGARLSQVGRFEEALTATEQAVEIWRRLAAASPDTYDPDLARSLSSLGQRFWQVGRMREALTATEQAVEIRRRLAAATPAAYESDLAGSLSNLGVCLWETGRWEEALAAELEAVEIRRRLAAASPSVHEPVLATSLSNLGVRLSELDRWEEALAAELEAVEIRRRLAAANPATYETLLAHSLSHLGIRLWELDRWEEALAAELEAVEIRRRLAAASPSLHEPELAGSLSNMGACLSQVGRSNEALAATEEAVDIYHRLAAAKPAVYDPDLATSLTAYAWVRLEVQQDLSGALRATEKAVEIYRNLMASRPTKFLPNLRSVLDVQADLLVGLGRPREASEVRQWLAGLTKEQRGR